MMRVTGSLIVCFAIIANGQNLSPVASCDDVDIVVADIIGKRAYGPNIIGHYETGCAVIAWSGGAVDWGAALSETNIAAARERVTARNNDITAQHSRLSVEERALGMAMIDMFNGRFSNLVVTLNQKMGLTGTNRITAASIGGTITPKEASQILQGYLQ